MKDALRNRKIAVVGLGKTGLSCVRFLKQQNVRVEVFDTRDKPVLLDELLRIYPDLPVSLGELSAARLSEFDEILLSPGLPMSDPAIQSACKAGVRVRGDIDLFVEFAKAPVAAITGSNGKSTVTTLLGEMAKSAGVKVAVGGNLGVPVLDLLSESVELYILELSSFQLETTQDLGAECAVILNISEDHMDRYPSRSDYLKAKQRIFQKCNNVIINDDDMLTHPPFNIRGSVIHFGFAQQESGKFSTLRKGADEILYKGFDALVSASELKIKGKHNIANALAALAMGDSLGFPMDAMLTALKNYEGLPHRCQWVRSLGGVDYINDSKGTNVGASCSAIESFGLMSQGDILLIAGGEGKAADFSPLAEAMKKWGRFAALFGQDKAILQTALAKSVETVLVENLAQAVNAVKNIARQGDVILFSPACSSFDMYSNFEARGDDFISEVKAL